MLPTLFSGSWFAPIAAFHVQFVFQETQPAKWTGSASYSDRLGSFLERRLRRPPRASMSNFGCSTRARNPGAQNHSTTKTTANRLTMATIQSITGLLLSGYRRHAKERSDVATEQQPIGVGKLIGPRRHSRPRDTVF